MATVTEIAKIAGVSPVTVSRILNGNADYNRPTFRRRAEKIRKLADQMGYKRNASAHAIRSGRFNAATLLLGAASQVSHLPTGLLGGVHDALAERDMSLNFVQMADEKLVEEGIVPRLLREKASDGLLIDYICNVPPQLVQQIERHRVPAIWLNANRPMNSVCPDDFAAGHAATRRLLEAGHRRIIYISHDITGENLHYSVLDRRAGYEAAMTEAGLSPRSSTHRPGRFQLESVLAEWFRGPEPPTAVVGYSPSMAPPVLIVMAGLGLRFPEDVSLVTFSDHPYGLTRPIDLLLTPDRAMGRAAVDMLLKRIATGEDRPSQSCDFQWSEGDSIRPFNPAA